MAVRFDAAFKREIKRAVDAYQHKRARLIQKGYRRIPEAEYVSQIMNDYSSRDDIRRKLKQLRQFGKRGMEELTITSEGVMSEYEYQVFKQDRTLARRRNAQALKELDKSMNWFNPVERRKFILLKDRAARLYSSSLRKKDVRAYHAIVDRLLRPAKYDQIFIDNVLLMINESFKGQVVDRELARQLKQLMSKWGVDDLAEFIGEDSDFQALINGYKTYMEGGKPANLNETYKLLIEKLGAHVGVKL